MVKGPQLYLTKAVRDQILVWKAMISHYEAYKVFNMDETT